MDEREAIKSLNNIIKCWTYKSFEYWIYKPSEVASVKLAIAALEKQMPIQVEIVDYNYQNLPVEGCPVCKNRHINYTQNYCPACGQKIYWV